MKQKVSQSEITLKPKVPSKPTEALRYAFGIEHEGKALWAVYMYTIEGFAILSKHKISSGNPVKLAIRHLDNALLQLEINQRHPDKVRSFEVMPSMGAR